MNIIIYKFIRAIKNFIHRHEVLETAALVCLGVATITRTFFVFRTIRHAPPWRNYKIILLTIRTLPNPGLVHFETVFFHAFRSLGVEAKMLFHDNALHSTDAATYYRSERPQNFVSTLLGKLFKSSLRVDALSYRNFLTEKNTKKIKKEVAELPPAELEKHIYLGVKVGLHARASAIRYFLTGSINLSNPDHVGILREKLFYAIIATTVARRLVAREKPDLLFSLHGVYSTWGPFHDYFQRKGIDTLVYNLSALRFGHFTFNRNSNQNEIASKKEWKRFSRLPLTQKEEAAVDHYFTNRLKNVTNDQKIFKSYFNRREQKDALLKKLSTHNYRRRYILYPNLAWDEVLAGRVSSSFQDVFEWIDTTIHFFKRNPSYQLIVKPHPAESIWEKGTKSIRQYIVEHHAPLPKNITILPPDVSLSAYDLLEDHTIGLVFSGTLGLELPAIGLPVLAVAEKMHYGEAGVAYPVKTASEYVRLLEDPSEVVSFTKRNIQRTKKYAYFYYFKSMIRIPFYRKDIWSTIDWGAIKNMDALLHKNSPIIKICKKLIKREDIVAPL